MKLTQHSKIRFKERAGLRSSEQIKLFREALLHGKSPGNIKDYNLRKFLQKPHAKTKLYKGYVFIYSKNHKMLYTMYKLPERFVENDNS